LYKQKKSACRLHRRCLQGLLLSLASLSASPEHLLRGGVSWDVDDQEAKQYHQSRTAYRPHRPQQLARLNIVYFFSVICISVWRFA
jgi:hypothetical protein